MIYQNIIQVVNTGSDGNCCVIHDSYGNALLLDLGVSMEAVLKALNYHVECVKGALISHRHVDHARYIPAFIRSGVKVYVNNDTWAMYPDATMLRMKFNVGDAFTIRTCEVEHNVPCNLFLIDTKDNIRILYITDTNRATVLFKNVDYLIIECNHDMETIVDTAMETGNGTASQYYNHLSLEKCVDYIAHMDKGNLKGILLWHSSSSNLNKERAIREVKEASGIDNVWLAKRDLKICMFDDNF